MATLAQLRAGLETRLKTISGLETSAYWPAQITPPSAWVKPVAKSERQVMGGLRVPSLEIIIAAAPETAPYEVGQALLDPYLDDDGALSLIAALEGDHTLGGIATSVTITWGDYDMTLINGLSYYAAKLLVTVWP